jgi:transcriptional regulator with XRE-family HTH domain
VFAPGGAVRGEAMGRPEQPLDPGAGPIAGFAHELRQLRRAAGLPSYRTLARKAGYSASVLSTAANGVHAPTLPVVLAFAGACGGDLIDWEQRWRRLEKEIAPGLSVRPDRVTPR